MIVISVDESDFSEQLTVRPNPGGGHFWLDLGETVLDGRVEVYEAQGKRVWGERIGGVREVALDLTHLSDGVYFVRVRAGDRFGTTRLLVRR